MRKILLALAAVTALGACSDSDGARRHLKNLGYTNVQTTGYKLFGCGKDDTWSTGFTATNINGRKVSGVVCSGLFKGSTVRFY